MFRISKYELYVVFDAENDGAIRIWRSDLIPKFWRFYVFIL